MKEPREIHHKHNKNTNLYFRFISANILNMCCALTRNTLTVRQHAQPQDANIATLPPVQILG
jgi:hypothetical protein